VGVTGSLERSPLIMFMVVPLFFTAVASVVFGFYPDLFLKLINVFAGI
jgi:multicomponent Na+:H+ antiporter subunit D